MARLLSDLRDPRCGDPTLLHLVFFFYYFFTSSSDPEGILLIFLYPLSVQSESREARALCPKTDPSREFPKCLHGI